MGEHLKKKVYGPAFYINCQFDSLVSFSARSRSNCFFPTHPDREIHDIKPGEILLCKKKQAGSASGKARVISFLNGLCDGSTKDNYVKFNDYIRDNYTFLGVAETEHKATGKRDLQGLVARVGGVVTVLNESEGTIHPGAAIVAAVPQSISNNLSGRKGVHPDKARCVFREINDDPHIAIVGTAKSFAKKGSRFELLLHHRSY